MVLASFAMSTFPLDTQQGCIQRQEFCRRQALSLKQTGRIGQESFFIMDSTTATTPNRFDVTQSPSSIRIVQVHGHEIPPSANTAELETRGTELFLLFDTLESKSETLTDTPIFGRAMVVLDPCPRVTFHGGTTTNHPDNSHRAECDRPHFASLLAEHHVV
jgi:hypothetical protein